MKAIISRSDTELFAITVYMQADGPLGVLLPTALDFGAGGTRDVWVNLHSGVDTRFAVCIRPNTGESWAQLLSFVLQRLTLHGIPWELAK